MDNQPSNRVEQAPDQSHYPELESDRVIAPGVDAQRDSDASNQEDLR